MVRIIIWNFFWLIIIFVGSKAMGQDTISRQVIGSTGAYVVGTNISLSSTVGEAAVQTHFSSQHILSQGFQQLTTDDGALTYEVLNEQCIGGNNGSVFIANVTGCAAPYTTKVKELNGTTFLNPLSLSTGNYYVEITGANGCFQTIFITVGLENDFDCTLRFYSGLAITGEANNKWIIDNIEMHPENTVKIFNRWGNEVWKGSNYNNDDVVWEGLNKNNSEMGSATYFYVVEIGNQTYNGWVELIR